MVVELDAAKGPTKYLRERLADCVARIEYHCGRFNALCKSLALWKQVRVGGAAFIVGDHIGIWLLAQATSFDACAECVNVLLNCAHAMQLRMPHCFPVPGGRSLVPRQNWSRAHIPTFPHVFIAGLHLLINTCTAFP